MKKISLIISAIAIFAFSSCNHENNAGNDGDLSAVVTSADLFSITVDVTTSPVNSYFIKCYRASSFNGVTVDAVVKGLARRVEDGESWADFLKFGSQSITFDNLSYGADYKIFLFGLRGDGSVSGESIVLDASTKAFTAEITISDVDYFGFSAQVEPNDDSYAWAPFVFPYDPYFDTQKGLLNQVMNELNSLEYGDIAFKGKSPEPIYNICNPGMETVFCVCAIDEDLNVISDIFAKRVEIPFDGFPVLAEDRKDYGRVCLYTNDHIGIGAMIELFETSDEQFVIPIVDINSLSADELGVDLYNDPDEKVEAFYVAYAQAFYDSIVNDPSYQSIIETMTPLEIMQSCFYSTALFKLTYGTKWDPFTKEQLELIGGPLETAVYSMCLLKIDDEHHISTVPGSLARAKYCAK